MGQDNTFFQPGRVARFLDNGGESQIARIAGVLQKSDDGGATFGPLGGASFGADTIVQLANNVPAFVNALELLLSMPATAPGTEMSAWDIKTLINGVQTIIARFGQTSALPFFQLGLPANNDGWRKNAANSIQTLISGTTYHQIDSATGIQDFVGHFMTGAKLKRALTASTAVATTVTLPTAFSFAGNLFPMTVGTGTLNSIVATGFANGDEIKLILPSGVTITNNVSGSGATILTSTGASIVTASKRVIPFYYDGTNWITEG